MVRDVLTVRPDMPAGQLLEEMIRRRHAGIPVVDEAGRVIGVIGLREFQEGYDPSQPVASLMRTDFCRLGPEAPAMEAFETMGRRDFARCLVLDGEGRLQGLLSKSDLMRLMRIRTAALTAASRRVPYGPEPA